MFAYKFSGRDLDWFVCVFSYFWAFLSSKAHLRNAVNPLQAEANGTLTCPHGDRNCVNACKASLWYWYIIYNLLARFSPGYTFCFTAPNRGWVQSYHFKPIQPRSNYFKCSPIHINKKINDHPGQFNTWNSTITRYINILCTVYLDVLYDNVIWFYTEKYIIESIKFGF